MKKISIVVLTDEITSANFSNSQTKLSKLDKMSFFNKNAKKSFNEKLLIRK